MQALISQVYQNIKQNQLIIQNDRVILGLSGGPDSVFLFHALKKIANKIGFVFQAAHVNYNLRAQASITDQKFCQKLCQNNQIDLWLLNVNPKHHPSTGIENWARQLRYDFFQRLTINQPPKTAKFFCNTQKTTDLSKDKPRIALAHTQNDQTETIMFNFIRGSGLMGLQGMSFNTIIKSIFLIRPLLNIPKNQIIDYLQENQHQYQIDFSNFDLKYSRNLLRQTIIPKLKKRLNPNLDQTISRNARVIKSCQRYLEEKAKKNLTKASQQKKHRLILNHDFFKQKPLIIQTILLRQCVKKTRGHLLNLSQAVIFDLLNYLNNPAKKKPFQSIKNLLIFKKNGTIVFQKTPK
ncbi:MAG: tRNA lysidine(34) synthetase TilS [Candidatus Moranbacteria bacterium]|nr:tRNA lysidine(34) synthetase TilS [Candidatus Moranbacteria bacterium]